jgi:hypothetical protein
MSELRDAVRHSSERETSAQPVARCAYVIAAILLGQATWLAVPGFDAGALGLVTAAIAVCAIGVAWRSPGERVSVGAQRAYPCLLVVGVIAAMVRLPFQTRNPGHPAGDAVFFALAAAAAILAFVAMFAASRSLAAGAFWVLIAVHALMGAQWLTLGDRNRVTDVHVMHQMACDALLHGVNPHAITFPDVYHFKPGQASTYPPGILVDGRLQTGFPYPPLNIVLSTPAQWAGEVRYAHLGAILLSAVFVAFAPPARKTAAAALARGLRRSRPAYGPAVMLLFMPTVFYQVRGAWTEPFALVCGCATVFFATGGRMIAAAAAALGLFLVSKQFVLLTLPAAWLLVPRGATPAATFRAALKYAAIAVAAGTIVTLPFILWDVRAFFHSMTALFFGMLRHDSISYAPLIERATGWRPTLILPALSTLPAALLVLWRGSRDAAGFAASAALILLCAFVMSTQAFANYYFLAGGMLCAAAAGTCGNSSFTPSPGTPGEGRGEGSCGGC